MTGHNIRRILSGNLALGVQVSVHPISAEGLLLLRPLVDHENETIREGIRAVLAEAHLNTESNTTMLKRRNWSYYQNEGTRRTAYPRFADFVYQWY